MGWNGAGVFNRLYSWVADKAASIDISSTRMDADTNDITANGFGNCLTRDGQGAASANLPMNGFRHTGVQNGQARSDYAALGQVEDGAINWVVATGTADAITASYTPAITALVDGQLCSFRALAPNATATPTFTPNSGTLAAEIITKVGGGALVAGDIAAHRAEITLRYNLPNTRWELLSPMPVVRWAVAGGTSDALTAANNPAVPTLTDGQLCFVRASAANATTTPTFAPDGLTAEVITKQGGAALVAGNIQNLAELILRYNLANTRWELLNPVVVVTVPPQGAFKNLAIKVASNTTVNVTADAVVMTDGTNYQTLAINSTGGNILNLGSAGSVNELDSGTIAIDTWYAIWAIATPAGAVGCIASTSFSAPTMPSGYTFKARIGAVQTIHASATLYGTWQLGRRAQYVLGLAQTTNLPVLAAGSAGSYSTTSPTWSSASTTRFVPTTASEISLVLTFQHGGNTAALGQAAPNANYGGVASSNPAPLDNIVQSGSLTTNQNGSFVLEASSVQVALSAAGAAVMVLGWVDNI